jgi:thiol-disulfide isomerase/thioredoxin
MDFYPKYKKYKMKYLELKKEKTHMTGGGDSDIELVLFRAEWCPHCRNFVKDWESLEKSNSDVTFVTVEDKNLELIDFYENKKIKASSFPTLFLGKGDEYFEYVGPMSKDNVQSFLKKFN